MYYLCVPSFFCIYFACTCFLGHLLASTFFLHMLCMCTHSRLDNFACFLVKPAVLTQGKAGAFDGHGSTSKYHR